MHRLPVSHLRPLLLALLLGPFLLLAPAAPVAAGKLVLETENDFLTQHQTDDIYTFSLGFGWDWKQYDLGLRENAFTDRRAHHRFDETYLTVGRDLHLGPAWTARFTGGVAHVGRGLFGERTQNTVHDLIGNPTVHLDYLDEQRFHGYGSLHSEWLLAQGRHLVSGPVLELETAPSFKSSAVAAWRADWNPRGPFAFQATTGVRWTHTSLEALAPWVHARAPYADLEVLFRDHLMLSWSYNAHGTGREHLAIGYRVTGRGGRRAPGGSAHIEHREVASVAGLHLR